MIKFALRKNQLATEEPNFVANVTCMASKTLDDLVAKMVAEGILRKSARKLPVSVFLVVAGTCYLVFSCTLFIFFIK